MRISTSNGFDNSGVITVPADDDVAQTKANLETPDFGELYTSAGSAATFRFRKSWTGSDRPTASYVAIAGHNMGTDGGTLELKVNGVPEGTVDLSDGRNGVIFFLFDEVTLISLIELTYTKISSTSKITVAYVAAGTSLEVPNDGEMAGYSRPWLTRNSRQRIQRNADAAPVVLQKQAITRRQTLTVRNMSRTFAEGTWRGFFDFAVANPFFIRERDDTERSSYLCFDSELTPPRAHGSTRELVNAAVSFNAYTGL